MGGSRGLNNGRLCLDRCDQPNDGTRIVLKASLKRQLPIRRISSRTQLPNYQLLYNFM
jgi:hypothetical protein